MNGIYNSPIFDGLTPAEIDLLLEGRYRITHYKVGELILMQGSPYNTFLIVDTGIVRGEMSNFAGHSVIIEEISVSQAIAPAILFATVNKIPVSVIAVSDTDIISIKINDFTVILQSDPRVLNNFIRSMSDRSKFLSDRIKMLRFGTIKSKLANYLLEHMQHNQNIEFDIPHTQQELADMFGVTRPALSREIGQIADEGIIVSMKKHFYIKNEERLKSLALN